MCWGFSILTVLWISVDCWSLSANSTNGQAFLMVGVQWSWMKLPYCCMLTDTPVHLNHLQIMKGSTSTSEGKFYLRRNTKSWNVRKCIGYGRVPLAQFFSHQLMCLGYNVASTYGLIELLVLRGDYSLRELFKHITLFSYTAPAKLKATKVEPPAAAVSWVTAEGRCI